LRAAETEKAKSLENHRKMLRLSLRCINSLGAENGGICMIEETLDGVSQ
jgi:hypothetical protein